LPFDALDSYASELLIGGLINNFTLDDNELDCEQVPSLRRLKQLAECSATELRGGHAKAASVI
jgi:hypothetical protein